MINTQIFNKQEEKKKE